MGTCPAKIPPPTRRDDNVLPATPSAQEGHGRGMAAGFEAGFPQHFSRPSIEGSEAAVVLAGDEDLTTGPWDWNGRGSPAGSPETPGGDVLGILPRRPPRHI